MFKRQPATETTTTTSSNGFPRLSGSTERAQRSNKTVTKQVRKDKPTLN